MSSSTPSSLFLFSLTLMEHHTHTLFCLSRCTVVTDWLRPIQIWTWVALLSHTALWFPIGVMADSDLEKLLGKTEKVAPWVKIWINFCLYCWECSNSWWKVPPKPPFLPPNPPREGCKGKLEYLWCQPLTLSLGKIEQKGCAHHGNLYTPNL
jgi:hypothetical protein